MTRAQQMLRKATGSAI